MQWTDRVGRRIKLRDLHVLLAVANSGSISRAAERLAISHPVVSRTISDLEHLLRSLRSEFAGRRADDVWSCIP